MNFINADKGTMFFYIIETEKEAIISKMGTEMEFEKKDDIDNQRFTSIKMGAQQSDVFSTFRPP